MEEEVTFYNGRRGLALSCFEALGRPVLACNTYNGGESKALLLSVLEETEDVITDDDTGLAGKLLKDTHCDSFEV